jgi:hypothetical protein
MPKMTLLTKIKKRKGDILWQKKHACRVAGKAGQYLSWGFYTSQMILAGAGQAGGHLTGGLWPSCL